MAFKDFELDDISDTIANLMNQEHYLDNEVTITLNSLQTRYEIMIQD